MITPLMQQTPWQTVGPFFHYGLPWKGCADLVAGEGELGARLDLIPDGHYLLGPGEGARGVRRGSQDPARQRAGLWHESAWPPRAETPRPLW